MRSIIGSESMFGFKGRAVHVGTYHTCQRRPSETNKAVASKSLESSALLCTLDVYGDRWRRGGSVDYSYSEVGVLSAKGDGGGKISRTRPRLNSLFVGKRPHTGFIVSPSSNAYPRHVSVGDGKPSVVDVLFGRIDRCYQMRSSSRERGRRG